MFNPRIMRSMIRASAMVFELGAIVLGGALAGSWLDKRLDTSPLLLLILSIAMLALGLIRIHRVLERTDADHDRIDPHP